MFCEPGCKCYFKERYTILVSRHFNVHINLLAFSSYVLTLRSLPFTLDDEHSLCMCIALKGGSGIHFPLLLKQWQLLLPRTQTTAHYGTLHFKGMTSKC